ncbi:hypothetical protein AK830_g11920 [Neonectria ditissima]|uniref:Major facilitator superfamily (MFS) profile domain-containing protein n=1 Tax=Neonectria ditissima TaxID=78410 RepID=A0A0P7B1H8_9HYPO|nr:hypothetical protein AK830_g11920 [Neonectria ditissima]
MGSGRVPPATARGAVPTAEVTSTIHGLGPDDVPATEETPLLRSSSSSSSGSSSDTLGDGSALWNTTSTNPHDSGIKDAADPPSLRIGPSRVVSIAVSLWLLIFLQASSEYPSPLAFMHLVKHHAKPSLFLLPAASSMSGMALIQGAIAAELHTYDSSAMWFSSAYLIPMSSLAPVAGRLATIFAPRALILPVAAFLAAGGLLCATAGSFAGFVAGRVVAGVGAAGVLTLAIILGLELTSERTRGVVMGCINAGFTLGVSFGAIAYGGLMPVIGWVCPGFFTCEWNTGQFADKTQRPLFWIQVPVSLAAGLGVYLSVPESMGSGAATRGTWRQKLDRIDFLGASLLALTIVLFLYGLVGDIQALPILLSLVSLLVFLLVEYRLVEEPIIPIKVLSSRGILLSCLAQLGVMSARWTVLFYAPIFMLAVRGAAPPAAGSILIPTNLGFALGGVIVGWLHVRRSGAFWLPSIVSLVFFSASLYGLSLVASPSLPVELFVMVVLVNGLATGAGLNYTLAHILHLSHADTRYVTTSLLGTFRGFGGSFGTAIGGGIFYRLLRSNLEFGFFELDGGTHLSEYRRKMISKLISSPGLAYDGFLDAAEQNVAVEGYAGASRGVWQAAAALGFITVAIQAATGWTAPHEEGDSEIDEEEARIIIGENEGVGEA